MTFQRLKTKGLVFCFCSFFLFIHTVTFAVTHVVMLAEVDETIIAIEGNDEMEAISLLSEFSNNQLTFEQQQVSMTRGWLELTKQQNSCMFNKIKTPERLSVATFSRFPITIYPPIRLIVLDKNRHLFNDDFDLENLPENTQGQIGIVKDRAYGEYLDKQVAKDPHQFYIRGGMDSSNKLIEMLEAERVLGIVEYTEVFDAYLREKKRHLAFQSIPIRRVNEPIYGYIACSKGELGDNIIGEINEVMQQQSFQESFIQMHSDFFGEQEKSILIPELEKVFSIN